MAKIITRGEVNALREGTFDSDLTKAVLYSEVTEGEMAQYFVVESINSATGIEYAPTQAILETDIRVKADVTVQIVPRSYTVLSTGTSIIFDITTTSETPLVNPVYSVAVARYDGGEPTSASINQEGTEFTITFPANTDHSSKEILGKVMVTVDGNDFYSNTSTVSQNAAGYIEYNPTSMTVESTATTATVGFTTNCTAIGLSAVPTGGTAEIVGSNVNVTFPKNTSSMDRKVVREFKLSGYTPDGVVMYESYRIGQTQASATTLTFVYTGNTLPSLSGSTSEFTFELTRASLSAVTVPAGCSYSTGGTLTAPTLTFTYPQNTGSVQASYEITVRANDVYDRTLTASTTIQQEAAASTNMTINYTGGYKSQASGSTNEFTITLTNATFSGATANNGATVTTGGTPDNPTITVNYPAYTGSGERTITVTAYATDIYGETIVDTATFTQFAEKLEVTPATASIGTTATTQLTAIYRHVSGGVVVDTDVTSGAGTVWASNNTTAAEVNASGYVTAHNNTANAKTVTITATYNGLSDTSVITVAQGIQNWRNFRILIGGTESTANQPLYLDPSSVNARLLTFIDEYRNNTKIQSWGVSNSSDWTYDDPSSSITHSVDQYDAQVVNPVYESGTYYPTQRTAKVTATVVQGSTTFTAEKYIYVEPEGREEYIIESTPASVSIPDGGSQQLLIKYYVVTDGVRDAGTDVTSSVTYVSNNPDVTVTAGGLVSGTNTGTTPITANIAVSYTGTSGTTVPVTVAAPGYTYSLEVSADTQSISCSGTANCTAVYVQKQGTTVISRTDVTNNASCSWVVDLPQYATVSGGTVTGTNSDTSFGHTVKVQATYNGYSDDVDIFIGKAPVVTYRLEIEMTENYSNVTRGTGNLYIFNAPNSSYAEFAVYYSRYEDGVLVPGSKQNVTAQSELACTGLVIGPSVASSSTSSDYITFTNINTGYTYAGVTFWAEYGGMTTNVPFELLANVIPFHVILSANTYSTSHDGSVTFSAWTEYSDGRVGAKTQVDLNDGQVGELISEEHYDIISYPYTPSGLSCIVTYNNTSTAEVDVDMVYRYLGDQELLPYPEDTVIIKVGGRAEVITHDLLVSAATSTITSTGNTQCTAVYRTFRDGVEDTSARVAVTNSSTWSITSGSDYATVGSTGLVTGTNNTGTAQQVTVQASYVGDATYTASTTITVGAAEITHTLEVATAATASATVLNDTYTIGHAGYVDFNFYYNTYVNGQPSGRTDVTSMVIKTFTNQPSSSTFETGFTADPYTYQISDCVSGYASAGTMLTVSYAGLSRGINFVFLAEIIPLHITLSSNVTTVAYVGDVSFAAQKEWCDGYEGGTETIDIYASEGAEYGKLVDSPEGIAGEVHNMGSGDWSCIVTYSNLTFSQAFVTMQYVSYVDGTPYVSSNTITITVNPVPTSAVTAYLTLSPSSGRIGYGATQTYGALLYVYYGDISIVSGSDVTNEVRYSADSQYATVNGSTVTNNNNSSSDVNATITGVYTGSTYASYIPAGMSASGTAQLSLVKQFVPTLTFDVSGTSDYTITVNGSEFVNPSQVAAGTQVNWNVSAPHFTTQSGSFQMPSSDTAITVNLVRNEFPLYMKVEFDTGVTSSVTITDTVITGNSVVVRSGQWGMLGYYANNDVIQYSVDGDGVGSGSLPYGPLDVDTYNFVFNTAPSSTYPDAPAWYLITPTQIPTKSYPLTFVVDPDVPVDITVNGSAFTNGSSVKANTQVEWEIMDSGAMYDPAYGTFIMPKSSHTVNVELHTPGVYEEVVINVMGHNIMQDQTIRYNIVYECNQDSSCNEEMGPNILDDVSGQDFHFYGVDDNSYTYNVSLTTTALTPQLQTYDDIVVQDVNGDVVYSASTLSAINTYLSGKSFGEVNGITIIFINNDINLYYFYIPHWGEAPSDAYWFRGSAVAIWHGYQSVNFGGDGDMRGNIYLDYNIRDASGVTDGLVISGDYVTDVNYVRNHLKITNKYGAVLFDDDLENAQIVGDTMVILNSISYDDLIGSTWLLTLNPIN